jgi:NAD dependent epimerase/dehydratase family
LVASATGVLGMHVVQQLVADEYDVIGLTRSQVKRTLLEGVGARAAIANILDAAALEQVLRQTAPTAVIHLLTAFPRTGPLRPSQLEATNHLRVVGTTNLVRASIAASVRRIVGESFTSVYGFGDLGATAKTEADAFEAQQAQPWRCCQSRPCTAARCNVRLRLQSPSPRRWAWPFRSMCVCARRRWASGRVSAMRPCGRGARRMPSRWRVGTPIIPP